MRAGLFCTFENLQHDFRLAYADHIRLIEAAERFGFEQAWIAEHHFNEDQLHAIATHDLGACCGAYFEN
jgi:alkanesulfonate monooxygenase SsuD/methylene tetrahydromethanopterin reductase-like flavin-dependent oxidoreductase (luciferase family)